MPAVKFHQSYGTKSALDAVTPVLGPATLSQCKRLTFYAAFSDAVSAGVVTIETAPHETYGGVWAAIGTLPWVAGGRVEHRAVEGQYAAIRMRVSTAIENGTVDLSVIGGD